MKYLEAILATTHVDLHGERFTIGALEGMVEQLNSQYLPFGTEHDPRIPPLGRVISAKLEKMDDGEYCVKGILELYEHGDSVEYKTDKEPIPIQNVDNDKPAVIYDRSFISDEDQRILEEITDELDIETAEYSKKSVEPLSVLIISLGSIALGSFLNGFFEKMGADTWDALKAKIKLLASRKRDGNKEHIVIFQFLSEVDSKEISIEIILDEPADEDIDNFIEKGLNKLDKFLPGVLDTEIYIRQLVIDYAKGEFQVVYGVRADGFPLTFISTDNIDT